MPMDGRYGGGFHGGLGGARRAGICRCYPRHLTGGSVNGGGFRGWRREGAARRRAGAGGCADSDYMAAVLRTAAATASVVTTAE